MYIPYWTQTCPNCGATVDGNLGITPISRLGYEVAICPKKKCRAFYVTGAREWNHMTGKQKFWYLCSLLVMGTVVLTGVTYATLGERAVLMNGAGMLAFLGVVKAVRITLSKRRCPAGQEELTLQLHPFPGVAVALCGLAALGIWIVVAGFLEERWIGLAGVAAAAMVALWLVASWLNKVMHTEPPTPEAAAPTAVGTSMPSPPKPENPWAGKGP
jgi:hypothetical protein